MDYSVVSSEHNQLHWVELETKIILVKTRGICYLHYRQLAGLKECSGPGVANTWFISLYFQDVLTFFCWWKSKMKDVVSMAEKDVFLHLVTKDDQLEQPILSPYKNESLLSVTPRQGRLNHLPSRLVQGKETHLLFCPLHRNLFFSIAFPLNSCSNS